MEHNHSDALKTSLQLHRQKIAKIDLVKFCCLKKIKKFDKISFRYIFFFLLSS